MLAVVGILLGTTIHFGSAKDTTDKNASFCNAVMVGDTLLAKARMGESTNVEKLLLTAQTPVHAK